MFSESISLVAIVLGLAIVVAGLSSVLIRAIVVLLSYLERPEPATLEKVVAPMPGPTMVAAIGIPPHHLAIIAAAAQYALGGGRIVHIGAADSSASWAASGRLVHHTSHTPTSH